MLAVENFIKWR